MDCLTIAYKYICIVVREGSDLFKAHPNGSITVAAGATFDFTTRNLYEFSIVGSDTATPPNTATAPVKVIIDTSKGNNNTFCAMYSS